MRSFALVVLSLFLSAAAFAQQTQTSDVSNTQPLQSLNVKYVQGIGPGYWPTAGSGLTLNLAKGTAFCSGAIGSYAGGTLSMTNNTTNYVYLNTISSCVPAVKTSTFAASDIPIAIVVTSGGAITTITDDRTWFTPGGGCASISLTGDVTSTGCATTLPNIVTASTQTKITYNAKGQVTGGAQAQFSDLGGSAACSQMPALTGDASSSAGFCSTTLASVVTAGSCGDATHSCGLTYDAKGRITAASNNAITGGGGGLNGTVTYTSSQSASTSDNGKLVIMNCSSACAYTLPTTQPSTTWFAEITSQGSTLATIALGGSDTFNGSTSVPGLISYEVLPVWANSATSTDYRGDAPLKAGVNMTFTPSTNGLTVAASGSAYYWGQGDASASSGNNTITLGSTPVSNSSVTAFVSGAVLRPSTAYSISGNIINLTSGLSSGNIVVVDWVTANSTPGGISLSTSGFAVVQHASAGGLGLTYSSNVTAGNTSIVTFHTEGGLPTVVSGTTCGTYTLVQNQTGVGSHASMWYAHCTSGGVETISVTSSGGSFEGTTAAEFSGLTPTVNVTGPSTTAGSSPASISLTTTTSPTLVVAAIAGFHNADVFASSSLTAIYQQNGADAGALGYVVDGSTGPFTVTWTVSGAGADNMPLIAAAFN